MNESWFDKYKKRNHLHGSLSQERIINEKIRDFDRYIRNTPNRFEINIDDNEEKCLIAVQDVTLNNKYGDEKYIVTYNETPMKMGSLFNCLENIWIIVEKEHNTLQDHQTFKARPCTHMLSWLNSKGNICSSPVVVENATKYSDGIYKNTKIKVGDTKIIVTFPANENTNEILVGKRFLFDKYHAYEVTDTQVTSPKGLRIIMMVQTEIHNEVDNLDLLIADYTGKAHEYSMEIMNKNVILTTLDKYKLQVNIYDTGVKVDNPQLEFDVKDTDILSIEDDTITALKEGISDVSIKFKDIIETIQIQVIKDDTDNYTCEIEGSDNIPIGKTKEYIGKFFEKGVEISDVGTWNIINDDGKDYATIIKTEGNKCTIKATSKWIFADGKSKYFSLQLKGNTGKEYIKKIKVTVY